MARRLAFTLVVLSLGGVGCGGGSDEDSLFGGPTDDTGQGDGDGDGDGSGDGDGDGDGSGDGDGDGDGDGGPLLDVSAAEDGGGGTDCECGESEWSYIWIANSSQSTVSKVDTETVSEQGRFYTRPDQAGSPSRTSVSLSGRAVAVANRYGGVAKIWARSELCDEDTNGVAGLQTSTDDNPLPWGEDDCLAWYTAFDDYTTQRPVQWAGGMPVGDECDYVDEKVWTSGCGGGPMPGFGGSGPALVHLLDGDTGAIEATVEVPNMCGGFGGYGGAVDSHNNFWMTPNGTGSVIARVDFETMEVFLSSPSPDGFGKYGITVDTSGRPWVTDNQSTAGAARYDPDTDTWEVVGGFKSNGGIQQGVGGIMWASSDTPVQGVIPIDKDTMVAGAAIAVPGGSSKGVSIDQYGYVWVVNGSAHKLDPDTGEEVGSYNGLDGPYTYSDMTGWGLINNACNPEG